MRNLCGKIIEHFVNKHNRADNRRIRNRLKQTRLHLFNEVVEIAKQNNDRLPSNDHFVWKKFRDLHQMTVCDNWRRKSRELNLTNPRTLAEKIEWLKLNDHREEFIQFSDKVAVREYVLKVTENPRLLNRVFGVYNKTDDIPFNKLPQPLIIKANHWSNANVVFEKLESLQLESLNQLDFKLKKIFFPETFQWPYWHIKPALIAEELLSDQFSQLVDYKFLCFNGEPKLVRVCPERLSKNRRKFEKRLYFDTNWNLLQLREHKYPLPPDPSHASFPQPKSFHDMLEYSKLLSQNTAFSRIDFYDVFGQCRFGEITLYPAAGDGEQILFIPDSWNYRLGEWLELPPLNLNPKIAYGSGLKIHEDIGRYFQ